MYGCSKQTSDVLRRSVKGFVEERGKRRRRSSRNDSEGRERRPTNRVFGCVGHSHDGLLVLLLRPDGRQRTGRPLRWNRALAARATSTEAAGVLAGALVMAHAVGRPYPTSEEEVATMKVKREITTMKVFGRLISMFLFSATLLVLSPPSTADAFPCTTLLLDQGFPTRGPEETRWRVRGCDLGIPFGLVIGEAEFRTAPNKPFVKIFHDARVAEILVPYHSNSQRFFDISEFSQGLMPLGDADCPALQNPTLAGGTRTRLENNRVCRELRDRGPSWKLQEGDTRRGEEVVLWSVLNAFNYNYVIEWMFRDDGVIMAQVGATGSNLRHKHDVAHTHTVTWRLDVDLNGSTGDSVKLFGHSEGGLTATDTETAITREGGQLWDDLKFNALHIYDANLRTPRANDPFIGSFRCAQEQRDTATLTRSIPSKTSG
jgi:hypothetical protein